MFGCVFHDHLIQVNKSAYGDELYVYAKEIYTGQEKIYKWLGKYSIDTGRGSRYDQDHVQSMRIDEAADTIVLKINRTKCPYITNPNEEDQLTNIDTDYTLTISYRDGDFHAVATYPTNILQIFENKYDSQQEEPPKSTGFAELGAALRAAEAAYAKKSEIEKVITKYGSKKGNQFLSIFATFFLKVAPKIVDANARNKPKIMERFQANIEMKYGMPFLMEYSKFYNANSRNEKLLEELLKDAEKYYDKTLMV